MLRRALVGLSEQPRLQQLILAAPGARRAAARFVAGDTLGETIPVVRDLNRRRIRVSLNCLGEKTETREDAIAAARSYAEMLQTIETERLECNISVKLSQLGVDNYPQVCDASIRELLTLARAKGNFIRIDMESAVYVDATLALYRRLRAEGFDNIGIVLQSYLRRTEADLNTLLPLRPRVRLVKGAYAESPAVAYPRKTDVDANFRRLMERLLDEAVGLAIATHDERIIDHARAHARGHRLDPTSFEFQVIYGVRRDLQTRLVEDGYGMRVYVPFGTRWFPYFMRRLAERPANLGFVLRSLILERSRF